MKKILLMLTLLFPSYMGSVCKPGDLTILKKMLIFAPCKERAQFVNLGI
ncbi:MAG: hypothetical protein KBA74_02290 [Prevotella sp.]|jgi:hypothetical protein|nr:hypothetical protein [Prevotella sp.]MCI1732500.1 hypothetical protein [Prevotella sp.]